MAWVLLGPLAPFLRERVRPDATAQGLLVTAIPLLGGSLFRPVLGVARRSHRRPARRPHRHGADARAAVRSAGRFATATVALLRRSDSSSASPARASRWRCRWRAAGIRRSIRGSRWASPARATRASLLATLFAPRLAERFGWATTFGLAMLPVAAVVDRCSRCSRRTARAARRGDGWSDYARGARASPTRCGSRSSTA